jgi:hypothetical protein
MNFFHSFQGYNERVSMEFFETYDGSCSQVGGMLIPVS